MERELPACACTIAGSDSGGGAGVQADQKVFQSLGVWGLSVITALTAQNTREVRGIQLIDPGMVALQLQTISAEFDIKALKTGMLGGAATIRVVERELPEHVPLVLDPVMISTSRHELLEQGAQQDLIELLLPRATVVTPNIHEAEALSGCSSLVTLEDARWAGLHILDLGPEYVLIKGGHLPGDEATDILITAGREWIISTPRYPLTVHGAGCCYSAAFCAHLARGCMVQNAFGLSKAYMHRLVRNAVKAPSGIYLLSPDQEKGNVCIPRE
ncbi:MAG: bifunctional hydroxymethylpyrimidine kinase/phosphomethylpyrimidine kinase [Methanolinea sp.]|jgi:hydroxymethylpyrimidine/phosphomethylpyrimidine kinase|nr:bifunctional hydroxymethylpyrimidine kinase/phosphomethylpyrimidine kinase [Methanolinea sp.]